MKHYRICHLLSATVVALSACSDPTGLSCPADTAEDCWVQVGLAETSISSLEVTDWGVYAGTSPTDGGGVFRLNEFDGTWEPAGLLGHSVRDLMFVPGPTPRLYAAVALGTNEAPVHVTEDGQEWHPLPAEFHAEMAPSALSLGRDAVDPDRIYFGQTRRIVYESLDAGGSWHLLFNHPHTGFVGSVQVVERSRHGRIWAGGGANPPFEYLADFQYSDDEGESWVPVWHVAPSDPPGPEIPGVVLGIANDEADPDRTVVLTSNRIVRTDDGGETWHIARDMGGPRNKEMVQRGDTLIAIGSDLVVSYDFGRSWHALPFPWTHGPPHRYPLSLTLDPTGSVLVGTSDGVWKLEGVNF